MKKIWVTAMVLLTILIGGFYILNSYIYNQKQIPNTPIEPYEATLTGEYLCLPHKNTQGPQTLECAFGLKTDSGDYYGLDFGDLTNGVPYIKTGERFTASGVVTPIEMLSTDTWQKYPIRGIFSVDGPIQEE